MKTPKVMILRHDKVWQAQEQVLRTLKERGFQVRVQDPAAPGALDELRRFAPQIVLLSGNIQCDRALMESAPSLRAVLVTASGTETVALDAATDLGIVVGRGATDENAGSMAEAVIMLMLTLLYDLRQSMSLAVPGAKDPDLVFARMLRGRTLGLVGYGAISRAIISLLSGWGVRFLVSSRSSPTGMIEGVAFTDLGTLMASSDIVSVHTGLTAGTLNLIDADMLARMKPGAVFLNTARAGIVDEDALYARLEAGDLSGVALDVLATPSGARYDRWLSHPKAIVTPHRVGHTCETFASLARVALNSIENLTRDEPPLFVANPTVLSR